jgi:hypothetical protein
MSLAIILRLNRTVFVEGLALERFQPVFFSSSARLSATRGDLAASSRSTRLITAGMLLQDRFTVLGLELAELRREARHVASASWSTGWS